MEDSTLFVLYMILSIVIIVFIILLICLIPTKHRFKTDLSLEDDGIIVTKGIFSKQECDILRKMCLNKQYKEVKTYVHDILSRNESFQNILINGDYEFQDYIFVIQKSAVHICHRDNNGDFFNKNQKYPSYTFIVYLEDMPNALGYISGSHKSKYNHFFNLFDPLMHVQAEKGDLVLFNANLIHVGGINDEKDDHVRIQMKLTHKEDREKISYYENFNKLLNKDNTLPKWLRKSQKKLSCMFPIISDATQNENIKSARGSDNGAIISVGQQLFSKYFYGDTHFYDLPNAF